LKEKKSSGEKNNENGNLWEIEVNLIIQEE
jgi:hypothetical protein